MLSIAPVMHHGEAAGAVIIGRDVRERKRADREVRHALTLLQSTLDSTADGILAVGDGNNQRFVEMWRIPAEILSSGDDRAAIQFVRDQLLRRDDFVRNIDQLYAQPGAESFDLLEFKDGRRFERYSIGRILEGVNIRVWSFRDVTARFATEAAMRESELRYRLLFEQNAAGVCVTKFNGEIVDCNSTFAGMLGARRTDLVGRNIADFYARRFERDELAMMLQDASMLNGVEIELRRADGSELWVLQNLALVGSGETAVIHATLVDISDRKLLLRIDRVQNGNTRGCAISPNRWGVWLGLGWQGPTWWCGISDMHPVRQDLEGGLHRPRRLLRHDLGSLLADAADDVVDRVAAGRRVPRGSRSRSWRTQRARRPARHSRGRVRWRREGDVTFLSCTPCCGGGRNRSRRGGSGHRSRRARATLPRECASHRAIPSAS